MKKLGSTFVREKDKMVMVYDPRWHVRASYRKGLTPSSNRIHWIGFRCVIPESE